MEINPTSGKGFIAIYIYPFFSTILLSLTYLLICYKSFNRGGDFLPRQANGEHPKQLNYSRAFGGKDLKKYGLIAEPDVSHFEILPEDKLVLIASDGTCSYAYVLLLQLKTISLTLLISCL